MRHPIVRAALGSLVVMVGVIYWAIARHDPAAAQAGALGYIALILTVAVVTKWL